MRLAFAVDFKLLLQSCFIYPSCFRSVLFIISLVHNSSYDQKLTKKIIKLYKQLITWLEPGLWDLDHQFDYQPFFIINLYIINLFILTLSALGAIFCCHLITNTYCLVIVIIYDRYSDEETGWIQSHKIVLPYVTHLHWIVVDVYWGYGGNTKG